jgi:predicted protein tyrosine phosphatase
MDKTKIFIMSKPQFNSIMGSHGIDDSNVEAKAKEVAIISINDTMGQWNASWFNQDHSNVIRLWFDDVENDLELSPTNSVSCRAFSENQAKLIIDFINSNKDKSFFVHCTAGISRSGAVGRFILDYLDGDKDHFKQMNPHISPNGHISRLLNNIIWKENADKGL